MTTTRRSFRSRRARSGGGSRRRSRGTCAVALATLVLAACGSGGGGSGAITVADLAPFTGADANLGPTYLAACMGATHAINAAGGVLGHKMNCKAVDTRGDPADAVPAARQMFAGTRSLRLVIGVTSDEASSVVPIINANKTVVFSMTGQSEFDHTHFDYFYRLVPPDLTESYAMVAIAQQKHYHRVALAFGNDIGSQTFVKPAIASIAKAGMQLVDNETLDLHATTFRTEAAKITSAHPDVIMTETLGSTAATFLSEVKQLDGGRMIPIIGTSATIAPDWYKSVATAVDPATLASNYVADNLVVETNGPAYQVFSQNLLAEKGKVGNTGNFETYLTAPGAVHLYDGINLAALAMIAAKSTKPRDYRPFIEKIGDGAPGAQVVTSFSGGAAALKQGKTIRYVGPGGPTNFDSFHDSTGIFQIDTYDAAGHVKVLGNLSPAQLRAVTAGG